MSSQTPLAEDRQEFEQVLGALLRTADRADVDVCLTDSVAADGNSYWEIDIRRVQYRESEDVQYRESDEAH
jgi:hypothetical protein